MEDDPTSFEKGMRSVYSSKWQEVMEVKMNSMNTNVVWDLEEISNWAKTVGSNGSTRKGDSKGNIERYPKGILKVIKDHLWRNDLYKEKE